MASLEIKTALFELWGPYWWLFLLLAVVFGIATLFLWFERSTVKKVTAGSTFVRTTCYKKKLTLGRLTDKAGTEVEFICTTSEQNPGKTEYKNYCLINPNLVDSKQRGRLTNGTPVMSYVLPYPLPISYSNLTALVQLMDLIKEQNYLSCIQDDLLKVQVIFAPDKYLIHYCEDAIETTLSMGLDIPEKYSEGYIEEDEEPSFFPVMEGSGDQNDE